MEVLPWAGLPQTASILLEAAPRQEDAAATLPRVAVGLLLSGMEVQTQLVS